MVVVVNSMFSLLWWGALSLALFRCGILGACGLWLVWLIELWLLVSVGVVVGLCCVWFSCGLGDWFGWVCELRFGLDCLDCLKFGCYGSC